MATGEQIKALLKSYSEHDQEQFVSVALQIAAHAARMGQGRLAQELKGLVDDIKCRQGSLEKPVPIARPSGDLAGVLVAAYPKTLLGEMVLESATRSRLERVIMEYRQQGTLRQHGLTARRKLLLIGAPGCGKTMTAYALAGELKLPLFSVQLHTVITKFMGETASKLHLIFSAMSSIRGVYLFDEFDAIGADRGAANDVGEIRRVLNSFLQFLEQDDSDSVILAATNYVAMLDEALFRRFDDVIRYNRPRSERIDELIENRLHRFLSRRPSWEKIRQAASGLSHAEIAKACDDAAKDCVLAGAKRVSTVRLVALLYERRGSTGGNTKPRTGPATKDV